MIKFCDGQITDIMPSTFTQYAEVQALSYALQQACRKMYSYAQKACVYSNLGEQPEDIVDLMASELRTQYYRSDMDIETKRRLVGNTMSWHTGAGTPAAVEELVAAVFGDGDVLEWYEYGDTPYHFKIVTDTEPTPETDVLITKMVRKVKNARSHMRAVEIRRKVYCYTYPAGQIVSVSRPEPIIDRRLVYCYACLAGQVVSVSRQTPIIEGGQGHATTI